MKLFRALFQSDTPEIPTTAIFLQLALASLQPSDIILININSKQKLDDKELSQAAKGKPALVQHNDKLFFYKTSGNQWKCNCAWESSATESQKIFAEISRHASTNIKLTSNQEITLLLLSLMFKLAITAQEKGINEKVIETLKVSLPLPESNKNFNDSLRRSIARFYDELNETYKHKKTDLSKNYTQTAIKPLQYPQVTMNYDIVLMEMPANQVINITTAQAISQKFNNKPVLFKQKDSYIFLGYPQNKPQLTQQLSKTTFSKLTFPPLGNSREVNNSVITDNMYYEFYSKNGHAQPHALYDLLETTTKESMEKIEKICAPLLQTYSTAPVYLGSTELTAINEKLTWNVGSSLDTVKQEVAEQMNQRSDEEKKDFIKIVSGESHKILSNKGVTNPLENDRKDLEGLANSIIDFFKTFDKTDMSKTFSILLDNLKNIKKTVEDNKACKEYKDTIKEIYTHLTKKKTNTDFLKTRSGNDSIFSAITDNKHQAFFKKEKNSDITALPMGGSQETSKNRSASMSQSTPPEDLSTLNPPETTRKRSNTLVTKGEKSTPPKQPSSPQQPQLPSANQALMRELSLRTNSLNNQNSTNTKTGSPSLQKQT